MKNVSEPSNPPDELAQNVWKKSLSDELFLHFFFESSESDRFFNYVHDSNSIFQVGRINSENISARTVHCLVVTALLSQGKKQSSWSSHLADSVDLHTFFF